MHGAKSKAVTEAITANLRLLHRPPRLIACLFHPNTVSSASGIARCIDGVSVCPLCSGGFMLAGAAMDCILESVVVALAIVGDANGHPFLFWNVGSRAKNGEEIHMSPTSITTPFGARRHAKLEPFFGTHLGDA